MDGDSPLDAVLAYHERTKHHLDRYARSPGRLEWANQPDPFRRFDGAPQIPLLHPPIDDGPLYDALHREGGVPSRPAIFESLSRLFYDSLALSAWKAFGANRWSLRVNPSSGDLHPTEAYLIAGPLPGLGEEPGVYHYAPYSHALERRLTLAVEDWTALGTDLPPGAVFVGLASIHWRESWKYGERAWRYCQHDVGHAVGAVALAAAALGWRARLVETIADDVLAVLLGIDRQEGIEAEHPDCLIVVFPRQEAPARFSVRPLDATLARLRSGTPTGVPNRLSASHHPWPVIDEVAAAARYHGGPGAGETPAEDGTAREPGIHEPPDRQDRARAVIHRRRSAVSMDGETSMRREAFYRLLMRVTPALSPVIFRVLPWRPRVSLALFVHRVEGLERGLYLLLRDPSHRASLESALDRRFAWKTPPASPGTLSLSLLLPGDAREAARAISCHQEIASDGAFALGMLAELASGIEQNGPWFYSRLFWETGLIGQVLYLEAEAAGLRATGIGCFFDDAMHQLLGIRDRSWQSLYHFTVGGPVEDRRLATLPPYHHLDTGGQP